MPFHDAYNAEVQLYTLMHRGRWEQALAALDEWLVTEPWRAELLLRKALLYRVLHRYERGLAAIRAYQTMKPSAEDIVFLEVEFLLEMEKTAEALSVLDGLSTTQRSTAKAAYYRGRVHLARHEVEEGLYYLWTAYQREPGFNRALTEWASTAMQYYGKWVVRRELTKLLAEQRGDPTISVSVGLALNMVDSRYGQQLLRRAVERYNDDVPAALRHLRRKSALPADNTTQAKPADACSMVSEQLLAGHFESGVAAYYNVVSTDPSWMSVLAPLAAEVLVDELVRPEEARLLLEDALRREPTDYRLHLSYTRVFLKLGFGEEALSSANCALALAPETEKPLALVQRAQAYLLLKDRHAAFEDLERAITRMPDARDIINQEPSLRPLAKDRRFRDLLNGKSTPPTLWERTVRWLLGD